MNTVTQNDKTNQVAPTPTASRPFLSPDVNIYETENGYTLEAEMPGVNREHLEITLDGNSLMLVGRRTDDPPTGTVLCRESKPADFRRAFELDPAIDTQKIRAQMNHGLLILELPKTEAVKPRRIAVD